MSKRVFDEMMAGIQDGIAVAKGDKSRGVEHVVRVPAAVDVRALRDRLGLTQKKFAARFGFDARIVQDWEQGRRKPERAARILFAVIDRHPEAVDDALAAIPDDGQVLAYSKSNPTVAQRKSR